jgi:hypothetical protein
MAAADERAAAAVERMDQMEAASSYLRLQDDKYRYNIADIGRRKRLDDKNPGSGAIWRPDGMGRDIAITTVRDVSKGFTKVSQIMVDDPTPLSKDEVLVNSWLNDKITWKDVYKKKPIEYLRIVAQGCEPVWDSETKSFVAKSEDDMVTKPTVKEPSKASYQAPSNSQEDQSNEEPVSLSVDDLPF